ncbi:MAG: pyridoxal-phosphate dependent enzyme [Burkholderiaceae bacterium]|nr:pyridoxal-phosphate dependent enzyme [Burkholderiaceae bacterium]
MLPDRHAIEDAARIVQATMPPTPQCAWPQLCERLAAAVWLKHENHTPVGAFKRRGGRVYFDALRRRDSACRGVVAATRGNRSQSVALAARRGLHGAISYPAVLVRGDNVDADLFARVLAGEM